MFTCCHTHKLADACVGMRRQPNFRRFHLNRQHLKTALKGRKMWFECKSRIKPGSAPHSPYLLHTMQIMMMLLWRNYSARYFISQRLKCKYFSWIISSCLIRLFSLCSLSLFVFRNFQTIIAQISTELFTLLLHIIAIKE